MKCPKCGFEHGTKGVECMSCGIIFSKYHAKQNSLSDTVVQEPGFEEEPLETFDLIKNLLFHVNPETNPLIFGGRALLFLILFIWGLKFIITPLETNYTGGSFWHLVNLPFHEAGHIIFRPLGKFITSLGGSLGQLLMPLICLIVFLVKTKDTFAASFALWWFGENFMDLAPYINDARSLTLPLLGGNTGQSSPYGFHDWEFILTESGLIRYDHFLAQLSYKIGTLLMIIAFIWGGYILFRQYKTLGGPDFSMDHRE